MPYSRLQAVYSGEFFSKTDQACDKVHFGMHAINSIFMNKGYGHWKSDFISEYNLIEAIWSHSINMNKYFSSCAS